MFSGTLHSNGKLVAIKEWTFRLRRPTTKQAKKTVAFASSSSAAAGAAANEAAVHDEAQLMKQLASIEQEVASIQKLPAHSNVLPLLGLTCQKLKDNTAVRLQVFEPFARGSSLAVYLNEGLQVDLATLRYTKL